MRHRLKNTLLLSLFPGIDLLGRAFEETGFCVVRGPDLITGGDVRQFSPPADRFDGIIGGPPCQDFSRLNRNPGKYSYEMLDEFIRVIEEASPIWFLFENVVGAPHFEIKGYTAQRFPLDLAWFTPFSRRRDFVFGSQMGRLLNPMVETRGAVKGTAVVGSDRRSFKACCEIQGLPSDFDVPFFSLSGKKQAVANGVPLAMGRYVAGLIAETIYKTPKPATPNQSFRRCLCGCGRVVTGRAKYSSASCRKRAQRLRAKQITLE